MDMLDNFSKGSQEPQNNSGNDPASDLANDHPTKSDLIHSAQVLADVAKSQLRHEPSKYDKAEVAGATADLLDAAAEYGKVDESTGIGKYLDKAEGYLRHYESKSPHPVDQDQINSSKPAEEDSPKDKPSSHGGGIVDFFMNK